MDNQVVFKSAINGFDKKAVLDYIYKLNQDAEENQALYETRLQALANERAEFESSVHEMERERESVNERLEALTRELENERSSTDDRSSDIAGMNAELESCREAIALRDAEIREHVRINRELKESFDELKKKNNEIDSASTKIGRLLIEAHSEADKIVDSAQDSADSMLSQARKRSEEILAEAEGKASAIMMDANAEASRKIRDAAASADETLSKASSDSSRIISEAEAIAARRTDEAQRMVDMSHERLSMYRSQIASIQRVVLNSLEKIHEKTAEISAAINATQDMMAFGATGTDTSQYGASLDSENDAKSSFFR